MQNIVICFDDQSSTVAALPELVDPDGQPSWRGSGPDVAAGYRWLGDRWRPGDRIFIFGAGHGGFVAQALTRLLDTVGMPVRYLGLWDTAKVPGLQSLSTPGNVVDGRHAIAIDERHAREAVPARVDEVWFRGTHADITGGAGATPGLARIAMDWVLDGARCAGLRVRDDLQIPFPTVHDALSASRRTPAMGLLAGVRLPSRLRVLPDGARVHASVDVYLRARTDYWYRLPHCVVWADTDWAQRGERLIASPLGVESALPYRHAS